MMVRLVAIKPLFRKSSGFFCFLLFMRVSKNDILFLFIEILIFLKFYGTTIYFFEITIYDAMSAPMA